VPADGLGRGAGGGDLQLRRALLAGPGQQPAARLVGLWPPSSEETEEAARASWSLTVAFSSSQLFSNFETPSRSSWSVTSE
jgi:hypothetical protein